MEKSVYDVAESVEVVQLETNDSLLIPYVSQLIMTDQYFIIGYGKKCSLFSHSGKFVCDIAQKGSGPEEYTMLMNLLYINNRVLITDLNNKVNVYSLNGKFIESYQALPDMFSAIYPMSDKNFIGFKAQSGGDEKERLVFYRRDEKRGAIPYQQNYQAKRVCFFPREAQFSSLHDKLYFKQLLNDTIFSVDTVKHSLSPEYIIDWGKLRSNDRLRYSLENPDEELFLHMPYVPLFSMTANGLVLGAITVDIDQKKQYYLTAFYDKANHQADLFELKLSKKRWIILVNLQVSFLLIWRVILFPGVYFPRWQLFDFCQNSTFKRRIESCVDCSEAEIMNMA